MLSRSNKLLILVLVLCSVLAVGLQGSTISDQKRKQKDNQTSQDLDTLHTKIESYQSSRNRLPKKLDALTLTGKLKERVSKYTYKPNVSSYKLCATFYTELTADDSTYSSSYDSSSTDAVNTYVHGKGETCFSYKTYDYYDNYYNTEYNYDTTYPNSSTLTLGDSTNSTASDIERQTDIRALQSQIEAYYATYGYYPSFTDLNSASWRNINMKGLDSSALTDPDATSGLLVSAPQKSRYAYEPLGDSNKACNNTTVECVAYTLTATLSSGDTYVKTSL